MALNLAHIRADLGESAKAVETATEAIDVARTLPGEGKDLQGAALLVRAYAKARLGATGEAILECKKAIVLLEESKQPLMVADGHANLSSICLQGKDVVCAEQEARKTLEMSRTIGSPPLELEARAALAEVYEYRRDMNTARREITAAVQMCHNLHIDNNVTCQHATEVLKRVSQVAPSRNITGSH